MILLWILLATVLVSLLSLVGIITLLLKEKSIQQVLMLLIGFSAGALIGSAFIHLLPEALEQSSGQQVTSNHLIL